MPAAMKPLILVLMCVLQVPVASGISASFTSLPPDVRTATSGETIILTCRADCSSSCHINWYKATSQSGSERAIRDCSWVRQGLLMSENSHKTGRFSYAATLVIRDYNASYDGYYFCRVTDDQSNPLLRSYDIHVTNKEQDTRLEETVSTWCNGYSIHNFRCKHKSMEEGSYVSVLCSWEYSTTGAGCPVINNINWKIQTLLWPNISSLTRGEDGKVIDTYILSAGAMQFRQCNINNEAYYQFQLVQVSDERCSPLTFKTNFYNFRRQVPAKVTSPSAVIQVKQGKTIDLGCAATGVPQPEVGAYRVSFPWDTTPLNYVPVQNSSSVSKVPNVIENATTDHSGTYQCLAWNTLVNSLKNIYKTFDSKIITVTVNS